MVRTQQRDKNETGSGLLATNKNIYTNDHHTKLWIVRPNHLIYLVKESGKPFVCLDYIVYTSNTRLEVKCEGETDLYDLTRDELVAVYKVGSLTFT